MGNNAQKPLVQPVNQIQLDIVCKKITAYIELERDRKLEQLKKDEAKLLEICQKHNVDITEIRTNSISNINLIKWIKGANIVLQYVKTLNEHTIALERGQHDVTTINELRPAICSLVWSTNPLNLSCIQEWNY